MQRLLPDLNLLGRVLASGGEDLRKCMQCATCSAVCELANSSNPGPRKEMLWAQWGLRDRLMSDADLWLCHQCGDCTLRCPRGARPGDVMAALRRESVLHYSTPVLFGRWANQVGSLAAIALFAAAMLAVAVGVWQWSGLAAAELSAVGSRVVVPSWIRLPHGLLVTVFASVLAFDAIVLTKGARRFWRNINSTDSARSLAGTGGKLGPGQGAGAAFLRILWHEDFGLCTSSRARLSHHLLVVGGVTALLLTSMWVVAGRFNPLLDGLVYPLGFWNPWKLMANAGGLAVVLGASLMLVERKQRPATAGKGTLSDYLLLGFLLLIALTGFATELLHLARIEPLRLAAYAVHLVAVLVLFLVLPYTKLAHLVYRTLAMIHAERTARGKR